ncbi:hypothetical protein MKX01_019602 [Papaver californicum]|nr:hypothetical protein MKX01_019602 [Papaver californicum]
MTLACLICHNVASPSHSFRSYSVSSSENEGRCSRIVNCLAKKTSIPTDTINPVITSSKVTPQSITQGITGPPRLVRSRPVSRDLVRNWNFDEIVMER